MALVEASTRFVMFLEDVPLKAKIIGIEVLAILAFSLVGTTLEAVNQVVGEGKTDSSVTRADLTGQLGSESADSQDSAVVAALKFVCPFH